MNDYEAVGGDLTDIVRAGAPPRVGRQGRHPTFLLVDLTDIVRAGAPPGLNVKVGALPSSSLMAGWGDLASISCNSNVGGGEDIGVPFSHTGDPLLRDGRRAKSIKAPSSHDVFSRILQINAVPSEASLLGGDFGYANSPSLLARTMTEDQGMMQIRLPRNNPTMKRRKIQGKKVVCIPSPAANSRRDVVPSDLWAWRKYGQKTIKGSPFPRGYYRCSSSKGCSARKQVERSRTDPNMLVITYTSEHNHPWPTKRNPLAGLSRSTSKGSSRSKNSANSSRTVKSKIANWEKPNGNSSDDNMSCIAAVVGRSSVKEETDDVREKPFDAEDAEFVGVGLTNTYWPSLMDRADHHPDDFFADLREIEGDPYEVLFERGFPGNDRSQGSKWTEYPFNLLDWADNNNDEASFRETKN